MEEEILKEIEILKNEVEDERKKWLKKDKNKIADNLYEIGQKYDDLGKYNDALKYLNQSLDVKKQIVPENHLDIATWLFEIGQIYYKQGKYDESLNYLQMTLDIEKKNLPENNSSIAATLNDIGLVHYYQGKYDEALKFYQNSIEIKKQTLPSNHTDLAATINNIGSVYFKQEKYNEALKYSQDALEMDKKSLPKNHPYIAFSLNLMGNIYLNQGKLENAWQKLNEALYIRKEMLSKDNPAISVSLASIGDYYRIKGQYDEAMQNYNEALRIYRNSLPPDHPDIAKVLYNIGLLHYDKKNYDESLRYLYQSLEMRKKTLPSAHQDISKNSNYIELVYKNQGKYQKALEYLNDTTERSFCERKLRDERQNEERNRNISAATNSLSNINIDDFERSSSSGSTSNPSRKKSRREDPLIGETFKSRYKAKKILGRGSYGRVFLVYDETEKSDKAMKMMEKFDSNEEDKRESYVPAELSKSAQNELRLMKTIKHENIIRYFDNFDEDRFSIDYLCIICEFCPNRDLKTRIKEAIESKKTFSEVTILNWTLQATNGLKYLHSNKIIHRDIKPENIFLDENNVIKLGDLGLSKLIESTKESTYAGTPVYMSPEQFKCLHEIATYTAKTDIWSLGCVIYELLFLKLAFPRGQRGNPPVPNLGSTLFSRILQRMIEKNVEIRFNSTELFDSLMKIKSVVD